MATARKNARKTAKKPRKTAARVASTRKKATAKRKYVRKAPVVAKPRQRRKSNLKISNKAPTLPLYSVADDGTTVFHNDVVVNGDLKANSFEAMSADNGSEEKQKSVGEGVNHNSFGESHAYPNLSGTYLEMALNDALSRADSWYGEYGHTDIRAATALEVLHDVGATGQHNIFEARHSLALSQLTEALSRYISSHYRNKGALADVVDKALFLDALAIEELHQVDGKAICGANSDQRGDSEPQEPFHE